MKRRFWVVASTILFSCCTAATALAGEWRQDEVGWRYLDDNGEFLADRWYEEERVFYHFDDNGYMNTGWFFEPLDLTGVAPEYWDAYIEGTHGYQGYFYYFLPDGRLVQNAYTPDGYWVDAAGSWTWREADLEAAAAYEQEQKQMREDQDRKRKERERKRREINTHEELSDNYAEEALELINEKRAERGRQPLEMTEELNAAACIRAEEMSESFEHKRLNGEPFYSVLQEVGIEHTFSAENGAMGFSYYNAENVVRGWTNSPVHNAIMLASNYDMTGIGCYEKDGVYYWCQLFITNE